VVTSLHRDFLPSSWVMYKPSLVEVGLYVGTLGLFFTLFLLFIRVFPVIAIAEVKSVLKSSGSFKKSTHHE
jgi:molybdopterin-containing oxidoreductase family membrane subunit